MKKRCPKCGIDKELVENPPRVLRHALPQLGSPLQRDVPFKCETCGLEVYTTLSYSLTGTQDHRPGTVQGQQLTEHQLGRVRWFYGKLSPSVSYPGVLRPGENVLFPAHEGRLDYGGVIDRHGDPDLMADFAAEYLKQSRVIMPMGRLPRTVSEMMPALAVEAGPNSPSPSNSRGTGGAPAAPVRDAVLRWPNREKWSIREPMTLHGVDAFVEEVRQRIETEGLRPFSIRTWIPLGQLRSVVQGRASRYTTLQSIASVMGDAVVHRPGGAGRHGGSAAPGGAHQGARSALGRQRGRRGGGDRGCGEGAAVRRNGALVVVDKDRRVAVDEQLFLVRIGEALVVKRFRQVGGQWSLVSDSLAHLPRPMTADDRIVGRVAWCGPHSAAARRWRRSLALHRCSSCVGVHQRRRRRVQARQPRERPRTA